MKVPAAKTYLLRWKGRESGPFAREEIEAQLAAGEVSRMHQVQCGSRWLALDDFLHLPDAPESDAAPSPEAAPPDETESSPPDEPARHSWPAIAALALAIFLLVMALTYVVLALMHGRPILAPFFGG